MDLRKNLKWYFILILLAITGVTWYTVFRIESSEGRVVLSVLDVGQGDAVFVQADSRVQVLIDGGPDNSVLTGLEKVMPFWDRSIDLVILTHPHADHLRGLLEVLKRYDVGMVIETGVNHNIADYTEWRRLLKEKNIKVVIAKAGQSVILSDSARLDILAPLKDFQDKSPTDIHDAMIVSKLVYNSTSALLTGDAERPLEIKLVSSGANLDSDILKVGHHGSKTSTTELLLEAVSPNFAVISIGRKNRYGHPHQEILDRLKALGIVTHRTDEDGDITFISDGKNFTKSESRK